ncbi:uncharacterized protein LOC134185436 [Corticium candelabrum]|uniref:uncharacterized protein LOC134185436 n=1 Tax=Corticium candelabrum TaxID=121492 RepID=UPI002E26298F|nr:uncharacterized protein LOC134185436 [Corticium candelabrum]
MVVFLLLLGVIAGAYADFNCYHVCQDSYPTHTYPSADHHWACMRGCRFYVIEKMTLSHPFALVADYDSSSSRCNSSCSDAYRMNSTLLYACQIGCGQTEVNGTPTTGTSSTAVATGTLEPQAAFAMIFEIQPFVLFSSSRDSVFGNWWSSWESMNGYGHSWLIMSFSSWDVEPSTAAPTLVTYCQGWIQQNFSSPVFIILCCSTLLLFLSLACLCLKPKKRELSIQADDLPLVKKPAVLGSLAAKKGSITTV